MEVIREEPDFRDLSEEWDALLASSRQDSPFLRHGRLRTWWEIHAGAGRLCIPVCRAEDGRLVGALPLYVARSGRAAPVKAARFLGDADSGAFGLTPFADPDAEEEVFDRFASFVAGGGNECDMLDLRYMDGDGAFFRRLSRGHGRFEQDCDRCLRIPLPDDWDSYLALMSKNRRHEVRRCLRRASDGGVEFELVCDEGDLSEAIEDMWGLHENRMSAKMGVPTSHSRQYRTFLKRMSEQLLAEGRLRLVFMRVEDRRIGALHQFRHGDVMYAERAGFFDPSGSFDSMRPLLAHAIRSAIEEGCTGFDMMRGYDQYKLGWRATEVRRLARARVYRRSVAGIARRGRDSVVDRAQRMRSGKPMQDVQSLGQE